MPCITYTDKRFNDEALDVIRDSVNIIDDYRSQGFTLTVRQIYYQMVAHDLFSDERRWTWTGQKWVRDPNGTKNAEPNYKWLAAIINDARLAGLIDWDAIEDITRSVRSNPHWDDAQDIITAIAQQFAIDKWAGQPWLPFVLVEKDAVVGVVAPTCETLDVPYASMRGYGSQSMMWRLGRQLLKIVQADEGQTPLIFYVGDHDPSGIDMTRDIQARMDLFTNESVQVIRLALSMDQIRQVNAPPNPAKLTDSRAQKYIREYGNESWELDALSPTQLAGIIQEAVLGQRDEKLWAKRVREENKHKLELSIVNSHWPEIVTHAKKMKWKP